MRTIEYGTTTHVPAFLTKLWKLVTDAACNELICWSVAGTSFIIYDEIRFSKELLPMYFKHNNMASFVRQLNMYGFRKLSCIENGGIHSYKNEIEFYHQYFLKGQETLLELIKRKIPNSRSEEPKIRQEYIDELISSIKSLKGKQDNADQNVRQLRRENRQLWRHLHMLADKAQKQQSVIQQLVPFFMNMVRQSREITLKRKAPLMIDECEEQNSKLARVSPPYYVSDQDSNHGMPSSPGNVTNRGPVIHEVTEMENSKMFPASILCSSSNTTTAKECEAIVDSPLSCNLESSEQTIDSPFTEPGTMVEPLNILNQNYESRSRSSSMSSGHSQSNISTCSTSSLRRSPPSAMSSTNPTSSYTSTIKYIQPTVIIDETTSDVPSVSGNLMNPFVPKIEDTCSDSGMYTMDSMINNKIPNVINESMSLINKTSPVMNEATPSLLGPRLPSMINRTPMVATGPLPVINENKFAPNYAVNMKNIGSEMNWMMNQAATPYMPEQNFDTWLGQIFKSDNLTAGCSLPSPQCENANFV